MFGSKHIKRCSKPLQMFGRNFFNTQVNGCLKFIDRIPRCYKNLCSSNQNLYRVFHRTWQVDSIRTKIFLNRVGRITQSNITSLYKATVSNLKSDVLAWGANKTGWKQRIRPENLWENHLVCLPSWVSQAVLVVKNLPASTGDKRDPGSIPGLGRSPGEGNGKPLQYSCLENPTDREACRATVHRVTKSHTRLTWLRTLYRPFVMNNVSCIYEYKN